VYARSPDRPAPLRQGEILSDLVQLFADPSAIAPAAPNTEIRALVRTHPFAIVMSQDCDLDLDYKSRTGVVKGDKKVPSVLFCEAETIEKFRASVPPGSELWRWISGNQHYRFHCLGSATREQDLQNGGVPELGIDFKRYFTVPTAEVYARLEQNLRRRCHLMSPYVEDLSNRFAGYLSRVALPDDFATPPVPIKES